MNSEMLLTFLRDNGKITDLQMTDLLDEQSRSGKPIEEVISNSGVISLAEMYQLIAQALGTEVVDLAAMEISARVAQPGAAADGPAKGTPYAGLRWPTLRIAVVNPARPKRGRQPPFPRRRTSRFMSPRRPKSSR